jgi:hypothetical protein
MMVTDVATPRWLVRLGKPGMAPSCAGAAASVGCGRASKAGGRFIGATPMKVHMNSTRRRHFPLKCRHLHF